ncbi:hypothetical protein ACRALDRAFT_1065040, partial [Sodiomyces alcalophilus JCM 7366]|uniref:uncharacterized protein n=1 Tax=Sodiomyces alcalophilus JCM 7366 TaxID=591952 RepID=UPI0039B44234
MAGLRAPLSLLRLLGLLRLLRLLGLLAHTRLGRLLFLRLTTTFLFRSSGHLCPAVLKMCY